MTRRRRRRRWNSHCACWKSAPGPRTTMQSPLRWSEDASWKLDYLNLDRIPPEELARRRREFDEQKAVARGASREGGAA